MLISLILFLKNIFVRSVWETKLAIRQLFTTYSIVSYRVRIRIRIVFTKQKQQQSTLMNV